MGRRNLLSDESERRFEKTAPPFDRNESTSGGKWSKGAFYSTIIRATALGESKGAVLLAGKES